MERIRIERDEAGVAVFRLDRPPVNALDLEFAGEVAASFARLTAEPATRAVVLTGTGACFSAGLDLKAVPFYDREQQRAMIGAASRMLVQLYGCPLPVVAAINGHAVAAGLILLLACDYRVGSSAPCQLGLSEARLGIPFPSAAMQLLLAEVAPQVARVLALRARNIGPEAALAAGLLDELQPPERVLPAAIEVAHDLVTMPPAGYATIKRQVRGAALAGIEETLARGTDPALESWVPPEAGEAARALLRSIR